MKNIEMKRKMTPTKTTVQPNIDSALAMLLFVKAYSV